MQQSSCGNRNAIYTGCMQQRLNRKQQGVRATIVSKTAIFQCTKFMLPNLHNTQSRFISSCIFSLPVCFILGSVYVVSTDLRQPVLYKYLSAGFGTRKNISLPGCKTYFISLCLLAKPTLHACCMDKWEEEIHEGLWYILHVHTSK